ncbi:MAG: Omp85 family outer membrane protein [Bacteroidia bacterium]
MKSSLFFIFILFAEISFSQKDSLRKPYKISGIKKLSEEDLTNKKEKIYFTALPDFSFDPLNGFGAGVQGSLFFTGAKTDSMFAYTPYKSRLNLDVFYTTHNQYEIHADFDAPYIFNTAWRFRSEAAFEVNPNLLYFGNTEQTLKALSYYPDNDSTKAPVTNASYQDYNNSLKGTSQLFNTYLEREFVINASIERSFFEGKMRTLIGYEFSNVSNTSLAGNSLLSRDFQAGKILGYGTNLISFVHLGLIYDTRDLETDPSKGMVAEITDELSLKPLGSQLNFNKTFVHFNFYKKLLPGSFKKLVFAARLAMGYTQGDAPFYEYRHQWSSDEHVEGLGGGTTLRGFKQARFLSRVLAFSNIELRYRFTQFNAAKQHFALSAVPFFDVGGVYDDFSHLKQTRNIIKCRSFF